MTKKITTPLTEKVVRQLKIGNEVLISGKIFTARDAAHKYLFEHKNIPISLQDSIIYHCGPIIVKKDGKWIVKAAGPTTSIRDELYEWKIISDFGLRGIIGKGGMGEKTVNACKTFGCCYFQTIGGAAQLLASKVVKVQNVYLLEKLGATEAIWEFEIRDFPAIVTIDTNGNNMHVDIKKRSEEVCFNNIIKNNFL
ncbi:MAG: fumarate hydrolyase [Deltaproteobacteria bacterium CG07_land_8_20_14_0_80_38_7]|nr:MAG: fumarate hydrolyase [Deltaproteobacteria bacterium CG07_land_8_20_14_0_80_38_7]